MQRHAPMRRQRGVAILEFAVALPLLLFLMLATAELGRLLSQYDTLTKAVRDGARYAAANADLGTTGVVSITPAVQTAIQNLVLTGNTAGSGGTLLPSFSASNVTVTGVANGYVQVAASYTYVPMVSTALITFGLHAPINTNVVLNSTVVMKPL